MTNQSECWQGHIGVYQGQKFDKEETFVLLIEEFHQGDIFYSLGWKTFSHDENELEVEGGTKFDFKIGKQPVSIDRAEQTLTRQKGKILIGMEFLFYQAEIFFLG